MRLFEGGVFETNDREGVEVIDLSSHFPYFLQREIFLHP